MPDTGPPWNIPYVDDSDLVRDFPTADEAQARAIAAGLTAAGGIKQVVQTVKTDTFSTTSTSFTTVTGLAVTITPSSASSKVLLLGLINSGDTTSGSVKYRMTGGNSTVFVGDAAGSNRVRSAVSVDTGVGADTVIAQSFVYLDSPATTSAITYQVEMSVNTGTGFLNRNRNDLDTTRTPRVASSIVAIEVAV